MEKVHWRCILFVGHKQRGNKTFRWAGKFVPPYHNVTAEVSQLETTFLDTTVYKGERFEKESILDVRTHYKPTETFQYTNYNSCHPAGVKKGSVKGEALMLLRTNSSKVCLRRTLKTLEHAWHRVVIPIIWRTKSSQKLNSQKERTLLHKLKKRPKGFYPFGHNFIRSTQRNRSTKYPLHRPMFIWLANFSLFIWLVNFFCFYEILLGDQLQNKFAADFKYFLYCWLENANQFRSGWRLFTGPESPGVCWICQRDFTQCSLRFILLSGFFIITKNKTRRKIPFS